ncbi:MAG: hypothetical protein ACLR5H_11130 [Oscillospiraceae bacterium]
MTDKREPPVSRLAALFTVAAERWRHIALEITAFCAGFPMGTRWCFFTIEQPEQMCYNGFENASEDKEEGVTEARRSEPTFAVI